MLKFALALGIAYEWIAGPAVGSLPSLEMAALRTLCATMLAWIVLETLHALYRVAMSLDPRPGRRG